MYEVNVVTIRNILIVLHRLVLVISSLVIIKANLSAVQLVDLAFWYPLLRVARMLSLIRPSNYLLLRVARKGQTTLS